MQPMRTEDALWLRRPLWFLIYGALLAYGVYALFRIPVEVLPRFDYPRISIITHYPGATATELEDLIARPIEEQALALPDLVSVRSTIGHGTVETDLRFARGSGAQADLQASNGVIDRAARRLPSGVHPYAQIMGNAVNEVADYTAKIPADVAPERVARLVRRTVEPALRAVHGVQRVEVYGVGEAALWVQPDLQAMHRYGIAVSTLVHALKAQVLLKPGGYLQAGHQDILIEARSLPLKPADLRDLPIPSQPGAIPLHALARVVRAPIPIHSAVQLDGRPSVAITVFKQPGASTVPVTRAVQQVLAVSRDRLPDGVQWVRTYDQGHLVGLIGSDLGRNLLIGALLATIVLFWVLGAGRGIWVLALAIPISLLLAIAGLHALGQSLNLMTLGALTVAVGLLADDAIIVLEAIYHRWESATGAAADVAGRWGGIRQGMADIVGPDVTGSLSTVAVFLPLLFVGGLVGLFFVPFALAMTLAILASLWVSLTLIPLGLRFIGARPARSTSSGMKLLERLQVGNTRLFGLVARFPRLSLAFCAGLLVLSLGGLTFVTVDFLPLPNEGVLLESFTLPPGTSLTDTRATVQRLTRRLRADPAVAHTFARIGSAVDTAYTEPAYAGEIQIVLRSEITVGQLDAIGKRLLRRSRMDGVQVALDTPTLERVGESLSGLPQPFVVELFGSDLSILRQLSKEVTAKLRTVPGLADVFNNDGYPITQLQLTPKSTPMSIDGITPTALYRQIRPLLAGQVVSQIPAHGLPLALYLRLKQAPTQSLAELKRLPVRVHPDGQPAHWVPLATLADLKLVIAPNQLHHVDGARDLAILATPTTTPERAIAAARQALKAIKLPVGYRIAYGGLYPKLMHAAVALAVAAAAALVLMLSILLLQFGGWLVPGLLLLQVPLALTGGALALWLSGVGLNPGALVAFLTLIGLSLNHGIVLLHRARRNERGGMPVEEAVREAIRVRFRPIVLTTLTAVLGMLPTALGWGQGAAPEQGLGIVILGGILWSALLTTNLIPALYVHWRGQGG